MSKSSFYLHDTQHTEYVTLKFCHSYRRHLFHSRSRRLEVFSMAHSNSILGTLVMLFRWHRHPISKQIVFSKPFARTFFVCAIWNALHKEPVSFSYLCYELRDIENAVMHVVHVVCNLILTKHYENIAKSQPKLVISIEVEAISIPYVILDHLYFRKHHPRQ